MVEPRQFGEGITVQFSLAQMEIWREPPPENLKFTRQAADWRRHY